MRPAMKPANFLRPGEFALNGTSVPMEDGVREFCARNDLSDLLGTALQFAEEAFPPIADREVGLQHDPETGEEWVSLCLSVRADLNKALDAYMKYVRKWVEIVPEPKRGMIRLLYNLA